MVKKSGEPEAQSATGPVVGGGGSRFGWANPAVRRPFLLLAAVIVLAVVGWLAYRHYKPAEKVVYIKSEQQVLQQELKDTLAHPPSKSASDSQKAAYYDKLVRIQEALGDYRGATDSFATRTQISTDGLTYANYFYAAQDYCKVPDKAGAKAALDNARALLPAQDNREVGYVRASSVSQYDNLARECGL